ncbi:hypothetical protein [Actinoplanes sp. CA-252034]|uniref:hypothetical protein n=1 Tax=Actinoplanes sp. CA-252034 TaxID=3239906 RepID=UPI003D97826E
MDDDRTYSTVGIGSLTFRETVARHPAMFFGSHPAGEWPLLIAALTAVDLLEYVATPEPRAMVTLHRDGDVSAAVTGAWHSWPVSAEPRPVEDVIRQRMWWHELGSSLTVVVSRNSTPPTTAETVRDELVWIDLDISVRFTPDAEFLGVPPRSWWRDGVARLQAVFDSGSVRLKPDRQLLVTDEAAGTTASIRGDDAT